MKTIDTHGTFEEAILDSTPTVRSIAQSLRDLILEIYPHAYEVPWPKQRIAGYGVGPKKMTEHFCYIGAQSKWVNLGFYYGAELPDPENLMEGTGKKLRHVKVKDQAQVGKAAIRELIQLSIEERKRTLGIAS